MARYLISEAARRIGVEAHVLRFWEEELKLEIPRNEQGHRYYTEEQLEIFDQIKRMKLEGRALKDIKDSLLQQEGIREAAPAAVEIGSDRNACPAGEGAEQLPQQQVYSGLSRGDKLVEFESIVYDIVTEALRNNNESQAKDISDRVGDKVVKEMNYLMRENEEHLEEHFRKLDEALTKRTRKTKTRQENEAAATKVTKLPAISRRKKSRFFPRRRKTTLY